MSNRVLVREIGGEAILLHLDSATYFGLDDVGTRFWTELVNRGSVSAACEALVGFYDVEPAVLRRDLEALVEELIDSGLLHPVGRRRETQGTAGRGVEGAIGLEER